MGARLILLDTHALVWLTVEPQRLSRKASAAIRRSLRSDGISIAAITLYEMSWLFVRGRLRRAGTVGGFLDAAVAGSGVQILPLSPAIAAQAAQLPPEFPGDPCDRLIAATAQIHELALVTADQRLRDLVSLRTVW